MTRPRSALAIPLALAAAAVYALMWVAYSRQWVWLHSIDWLLLNSAHDAAVKHPLWVGFWDGLSFALGPVPMRLLGTAAAVAALLRRNVRAALVLLACGPLSGLVTTAAKGLANRTRPSTMLVPASSTSFPSGHALEAAAGLERCREFHRPQDGYAEQCFYQEMPALADGETCVLLRNTALDLAVALRYNIRRLPVTTEWKCMASGDYALGIEPANCHVEGKAKERREGTLQRIEAFGRREFGFELRVLQGGEIDAYLADHPLRLE